MRLIGMLDSPYVRRTGISLKMMGLAFAHEPVSVFRHYDHFASINPVVKAPSLVTDDGIVLMDSTLILDYAERLAPPDKRLAPDGLADHARAQRIVGLALAACEKAVQIVYEHQLRPEDKRHQPWLDRVRAQLLAAYTLLEAEIAARSNRGGEAWLFGPRPLQADITTAVTWSFTQLMVADLVKPADHPAIAAFTARAEKLPEFVALPME